MSTDNKAAHTSGPWPEVLAALKLALPYVEGAYECAFSDAEENDRIVALIKDAIAKANPEKVMTNARLIAAAPELLAALEDLVELADYAMQLANRDGAEYDREAELKDARALIAEAKG